MHSALEAVLEKASVGEVATMSSSELRERRQDARQVEESISYLRRIVQVRMDLLEAEVDNRAQGHKADGASDILALLPHILGEGTVGGGSSRAPSSTEIPDVPPELLTMIDQVLPPGLLARLGTVTDEELRGLIESLRVVENEVSTTRRGLHQVIDNLGRELTMRYQRGESEVELLDE